MGLRAPKRLARREGLGTARERRPARPTRDALIPRPRASAGSRASPPKRRLQGFRAALPLGVPRMRALPGPSRPWPSICSFSCAGQGGRPLFADEEQPMTSISSLNGTDIVKFLQSLTQQSTGSSSVASASKTAGQSLPSSGATSAGGSFGDLVSQAVSSLSGKATSANQSLSQSQSLARLLSLQESSSNSQASAPHLGHHGGHHGHHKSAQPGETGSNNGSFASATLLNGTPDTKSPTSSDQLSSWFQSEASSVAA
jgi:hypothetical protein